MRSKSTRYSSLVTTQVTITYVLGFLFCANAEAVVLIRKMKPLWQQGLLNGIGGKIERGETSLEAMIREFQEETGVNTTGCNWRSFCVMHGDNWEVTCFEAKNEDAWLSAKTTERESIEKLNLKSLDMSECVSNLPWLLALALDENGGIPPFAIVQYPSTITDLR